MWSENSDQESTTAPILESAIIRSGEDHFVVKLLTSSNAPASSGNEVVAKLLSPAVSISSSSGMLLGHVPYQGLRKIEPKPTESENNCQNLNEADSQANAVGRYTQVKSSISVVDRNPTKLRLHLIQTTRGHFAVICITLMKDEFLNQGIKVFFPLGIKYRFLGIYFQRLPTRKGEK